MRQGVKHRARNRKNLSLLKTHLKRLRAAVAKGDGQEAGKLLSSTVGQIDKAAKKGVIHDNAAARYKSRLSRRVKALARRRPRRRRAGGRHGRRQRHAPIDTRLQPLVGHGERVERVPQIRLRPAPRALAQGSDLEGMDLKPRRQLVGGSALHPGNPTHLP